MGTDRLTWILCTCLTLLAFGTAPALAQRPCWIIPCPEPPPAAASPAAPTPAPPPTTPGTEPPLPAPEAPLPSPETSQPDLGSPQTPGFDSSSFGDTGDFGGESLSLADSSVGYIDNAIPGTMFRLRYDSAYRNRRPNRAEFFYAKSAPGGPGLTLPESNVDYQELLPYLELGVVPTFSVFVEGGWRFLNPEINDNTAGFGDMIAGFKWAFIYDRNRVVTFQLRNYIPTGDAERGLGTDHYSIEPGILLWERLVDEWCLYGEFRTWVPVGGTDFAGTVLRYGLGLSYGLPQPGEWWLTPVVEVVGWTVLDGKATAVHQLPAFTVEDAAGDTIVNLKLGGRIGVGTQGDFYIGWGRALTGDTWYRDVLRLEYRWFF